MPLHHNLHHERGRALPLPVTSQQKHEVVSRDISVCSSRYSRSSSVSSYARSDASGASLASTSTALSDHSLGDLELEGTIIALEDNLPEYVSNSIERLARSWIDSRTESPFDPRSRWPSPTAAYQDHNTVANFAATPHEQAAPVRYSSQACRDDVARRSLPTPPAGDAEVQACAVQQINRNVEASLKPANSSIATVEDEERLSVESSGAFPAVDGPKPAADLPSQYRQDTSVKDKLTYSAKAGSRFTNAQRGSCRLPNGVFPLQPVCCGSSTSPLRSRGHIGQQSLTGHPRRRKTDSTWQKPHLVRQDDRKLAYVHSLIDVAVSLITFIWPGSQRPLRVHNATQGPDKIGLRYFIEQLLRRSYASHSTLQVALYYCILLLESGATIVRPPADNTDEKQAWNLLCGRRMFFASLMLAFKSLQDRNYSARAWSSISGLSIKDINVNELAFLKAIKYRTFVHETTYEFWQQLVRKCADQITIGGSIPWGHLQSAMRAQRLQSVCKLEHSAAAYPTSGVAFPTGIDDKEDSHTASDDANQLFGRKSQPTVCPPAALSRRQTVIDRSAVLPKKAGMVSTPQDWERWAEDESARWVTSQVGSPAVSDTRSKDVLSRPRPSDARSTIKPDSRPQVDSLPPLDAPIEQVAEWTPLPKSPSEKEAVAPPAPRPGTMETPPDVSDEEAPKHVEMSQCFQQSTRDVDSGYESSSPETMFRADSTRRFAAADIKSASSSSSGDEWELKVLADDHVATQDPTLQESVRLELSSGHIIPLYSKTVVSTPCHPHEALQLQYALKISRTPQPIDHVDAAADMTPDEQLNEIYYQFEPPVTVDIVLDSANSSPAESTYYEENHALVEDLEEQALAHLDHRQSKHKNNALPIRTRSKRDYNTYSASHGEALANVKNSRSASKKLRITEATVPSRRQRNRVVTC